MNLLGTLIVKELKQIFRNKLLPVVFVILPVLLMNMVPRIATQEIKGIKVAVVDNDRTPTSHRMIQRIDASEYIDVFTTCNSYDKAMHNINTGDVDAIVEIRDRKMQISANATNGMKGAMAGMYITQIVSQGTAMADNSTNWSFLFNPTLDYKLYMIPAVFALLLILIVGFLPALNIVSEKEKGTIEQINVTPIGKFTFIISKIVPYIIIGLLMTIESLGAAKGIHGITPAGNVGVLLLFAVLFCMLVSSIGIIISNYSSTLAQAAMTMFFFLVIFILMSGLLTPIQSMPQWAQVITQLNPMRYFIESTRGVYIKGASLQQLSTQLIAMMVYILIGWTWAILSYRKNS